MVPDMSPLEKNSRKLVGVIIGSFPNGGTSEDLRRQFQATTGLERQSFYYALREAKRLGWLISSGEGQGQLYVIDYDAFSKAPASIGESQAEELVEEPQAEFDTIRTNGGVAITSLIEIVNDRSATVRQRLKAASVLLGYRVGPDVSERTKRFLESVCGRSDVSLDYKIQAAETLRRIEGDPQLRPSIEKIVPPSPPRDREAEEAERQAESARKRAHIEAQLIEDQARMAEERERYRSAPR
jgi:hypothetical protein